MDASSRLGCRYALHPVDAAFELEAPVCTLSAYGEDDFEPAQIGRVGGEISSSTAGPRRNARTSGRSRREQGGFLPIGPGRISMITSLSSFGSLE